MKSIFDSYVRKASVELSLIHGEVFVNVLRSSQTLCDVDKVKREISEMKQTLQFLSSLYITFYVEFSRDLKKQKSNLEKLTQLLEDRKKNL